MILMATRRVKLRTREQISFNMSRVRCAGSLIERLMEAELRSAKLRPTLHPTVFGRPDFAFMRQRVAVFCDSHFWHGYRWAEKKEELRRNRNFWITKIQANIKRDREVNRVLRAEGWTVVRFWEHEIKQAPERCVQKVLKVLARRRAVANDARGV